jgi:large repetitive protein
VIPRSLASRSCSSRFALIATVASLAVAIVVPAGAAAANVSHPATYSGTAASGGTVEFDVSADGSAVTRFATNEVTTTCGTVSSTSTGTFPIVNESFSRTTSGTGTSFEGSFPAVQQAQGTLTLRISVFPINCTSEKVSWTARTSAPPPDTTAPQTTIKSGPSGKTGSHKATFKFKSNEAGATFQCKLDGKKWASCRSPKTYKNLKDGKHTFRVKARDAAGNVDPSPAKRSWRVT